MAIKAKEKFGTPQKVYEKIYAMMLEQSWPVGTKIKPIHELAEELCVAYVTAQKAVKMLQRDGFLVARRGDGTYVTSLAAKGNAAIYRKTLAIKTHSIGVIMPYWMDENGTAAFHRITMGFLSLAEHHNWTVEMIYNVYQEAAEPDFVDKLVSKGLDGVFWVAAQPEHKMNIMRLADRGIATVGVGRKFPGIPFASIFVDIPAMAKEIVKFCNPDISKKVVVLSAPVEGENSDANSAMFVEQVRKALAKKKIELPDDNIGQTAIFGPSNEIMNILTEAFLRKHSDADIIIAYHEELFHSIEALDEQNFWKHPESMVIIDVNAEFAQNRTHVGRIPVTRVLMPMEEMGVAAAIELERKWAVKSNEDYPDLGVKLINQ